MSGNKVEVKEETFELLKARSEEKGFDDVDEYVNHVLDQVAEKIKRQIKQDDESFSEEDEEKVKKRLKGLGYLD